MRIGMDDEDEAAPTIVLVGSDTETDESDANAVEDHLGMVDISSNERRTGIARLERGMCARESLSCERAGQISGTVYWRSDGRKRYFDTP